MAREAVIDAIISNTPPPPAATLPPVEEEENSTNKTFTDKNGKKWNTVGDTKGLVVVRQVVVNEENGGMYEVPNTETLQTYTKEKFEELQRNNFFTESKMKVEILQKG